MLVRRRLSLCLISSQPTLKSIFSELSTSCPALCQQKLSALISQGRRPLDADFSTITTTTTTTTRTTTHTTIHTIDHLCPLAAMAFTTWWCVLKRQFLPEFSTKFCKTKCWSTQSHKQKAGNVKKRGNLNFKSSSAKSTHCQKTAVLLKPLLLMIFSTRSRRLSIIASTARTGQMKWMECARLLGRVTQAASTYEHCLVRLTTARGLLWRWPNNWYSKPLLKSSPSTTTTGKPLTGSPAMPKSMTSLTSKSKWSTST